MTMSFLTRLSAISRSSIYFPKRAMSSSFQDAISRLKPAVKDLVNAVTDNGQNYIGKTESDQRAVVDWIEKGTGLLAEGKLKELDAILLPKTYIATNYFTAADVAVYGELWPIISKLLPVHYYTIPTATRYFDHIQSQKSVRNAAASLAPLFQFVVFDFDNAPAIQRRFEPLKKKVKKESPTIPSTQASTATQTSVTSATASAPADAASSSALAPALATKERPQPLETQEKAQKKEKKEKKNAEDAGKKKGGNATPAADEGDPVPSMIDLRVGHIVDVMKHPDADTLYVEKIDLGEESGPRTVVSGLVNYIPIEEMRDKYLVAVCNLKPANMRGVKSFAMVLCASSKEGKDGGIELIQPPPGSKPGERVYFEGPEFENATPLPQLNPKKKIFETVQPGFTTLESREAAWVNPVTKSVHRIRTKGGVCVAPTLVGASLS